MRIWLARTLIIAIVFSLTGGYLGPLALSVRAAPDQGTYIVQRGDTLYRIASRFNTDVATLQRLNNLSNPNHIWVGQRLIVPDIGATSTSRYTTTRTTNTIRPYTYSPSVPRTTVTTSTCTYRVRAGDYLYKVARRFGVSLSELLRVNRLSLSSILYRGQLLRIPTSRCETSSVGRPTVYLVTRTSPTLRPTLGFHLPTPTPRSITTSGRTTTPTHVGRSLPTPSGWTRVPATVVTSRVMVATPTPTPPVRPRVY